VLPARSCTPPAGMLAMTVPLPVMPLTEIWKVVPSLGAISVTLGTLSLAIMAVCVIVIVIVGLQAG